MKPKRKVYLSNNWIFPIHRFEFTTSQNIDEVVDRIQSLQQQPKYKHHRIVIEHSNSKANELYDFLLKPSGRSFYAYIKGNITDKNNVIVIQGDAGIGDFLSLFLIFVTAFVFIGGGIFSDFLNTGSSEALWMIIFPIFFVALYLYLVSERKRLFDTFYDILQAEKAKRGDAR